MVNFIFHAPCQNSTLVAGPIRNVERMKSLAHDTVWVIQMYEFESLAVPKFYFESGFIMNLCADCYEMISRL